MKKYKLIIIMSLIACNTAKHDNLQKLETFEKGPNYQLVKFEIGTINIKSESYQVINRWAEKYKNIENYENKYWLNVIGVSCTKEIMNDSLINLKRAAKVVDYLKNKHGLSHVYISHSYYSNNCEEFNDQFPYVELISSKSE